MSFTWNLSIPNANEDHYSPNFYIAAAENIAFNLHVRCINADAEDDYDDDFPSKGYLQVAIQKGYTEKGHAEITVTVQVDEDQIIRKKLVTDWVKEITFKAERMPYNARTAERKVGYFNTIEYPYTLTIKCEITWYGFISGLQLHRNLRQYAMNSELSDFIIQVKDTEFPVHKLVLACQSPVFQRMFATNMKEAVENRIIISDLTVNCMEEFIAYIYNKSTESPFSYTVAMQLLAFAEKYDVSELKNLCTAALMGHINLNNVLDILHAANVHRANNLRIHTLEFMVTNQKDVRKVPGFEAFMTENPKYMFQFLEVMCNDYTQ